MTSSGIKGFTTPLVFAVAASAFGTAFQHRYNWYPIIYDEPVRNWIAETMAHRNGIRKDESFELDIMNYFFWTFDLGALIGNVFIGFVANRLGRKRGLFFNNVSTLLALICMSSSKAASSYELLFFGRFLIGFNVGLNCGLTLMYLIEIAPVHLRGAVGSMYMVFFVIANLMKTIVDQIGIEIEMSSENWPILLALPIIPAIFQLLTLPFCPESPKYLLFTKERESEAQTSLLWLRETLELQDEMAAMNIEFDAIKQMPKGTMRNMITKRELRMPLIIAIHVMIAQIVSDIYVNLFFRMIVMRALSGYFHFIYAPILYNLARIIMTVVSVFLVEKIGRRKLLLFGYAGMALSTALLSVLTNFKHFSETDGIICAVLAVVYMIMCSCGPNSIPWFYMSELFNQSARPTAIALVLFVYWILCPLVTYSQMFLQDILGTPSMWNLVGLHVWFFLLVWLKAPETKNKPIEEICAMFKPRHTSSSTV